MESGKFIDFATAVADSMGNGYIEVPIFEKEITNLTHKRGIMLQRIVARPATGHPTRYFEQIARQNVAAFRDPRNLDTAWGEPTRREKSAFIKAVTSGIKFSHFDMEVGAQQGQFPTLKSDDLTDMVNDVLTAQDSKLWTGADTDLTSPTSNEYVGLLTQIKQTATIADSTRMAVAIRTEFARLAANKEKNVTPSLIVMNPLTLDLMEQEEEKTENHVKFYEVEAVPGIKVRGIMTCMGVIPIVTDPFLPVTTATNVATHKIVILSENLLRRFYIGSDKVRVFEIGHQADTSLAQKFMALQYDTIVAKGADYAHTILEKKVTVA